MTVDFPFSYPPRTASAGKPVDVQTLQETFAALLRTYGTEKGGTPTTALLEIIRPSDRTDDNDQHQPHREKQPPLEKSDWAPIDRKLLDKSERRNSEMNGDYRNRVDKRAALQNDYQEQSERSEPPVQATVSAPSATFLADTARPNELPVLGNLFSSQQKESAERVNANFVSRPANIAVPNAPAIGGQLTSTMPTSMNVPVSMPTSIASPSPPPQTFTVFTPLGRLVSSKEKADDTEDKEEEQREANPAKKKTPFAAWEAIRLETARPIHRNPLRQSKEPHASPELRQVLEKPKEPSLNGKAMENMLNTSAQNVVESKKGESDQPNPMQYIHRIAAACEAAAQFAPIRMKINLDHLGTLALRFFYKADKLALRFETPSRESARFLRNHLDGLQAILSKRNVKIADIEIVESHGM